MKSPTTTLLINSKLNKYFIFFRKNKGLQLLLSIPQIMFIPEIYIQNSCFLHTYFLLSFQQRLKLPLPLSLLTKPLKRKLTPLKRYLSRYIKPQPAQNNLTPPTLLALLS